MDCGVIRVLIHISWFRATLVRRVHAKLVQLAHVLVKRQMRNHLRLACNLEGGVGRWGRGWAI